MLAHRGALVIQPFHCGPSVAMKDRPPLIAAAVAHARHLLTLGPVRVERVVPVLPFGREDQIERRQGAASISKLRGRWKRHWKLPVRRASSLRVLRNHPGLPRVIEE